MSSWRFSKMSSHSSDVVASLSCGFLFPLSFLVWADISFQTFVLSGFPIPLASWPYVSWQCHSCTVGHPPTSNGHSLLRFTTSWFLSFSLWHSSVERFWSLCCFLSPLTGITMASSFGTSPCSASGCMPTEVGSLHSSRAWIFPWQAVVSFWPAFMSATQALTMDLISFRFTSIFAWLVSIIGRLGKLLYWFSFLLAWISWVPTFVPCLQAVFKLINQPIQSDHFCHQTHV